MNHKETEESYKEILDVLKKHRETCVYDVNELESLAKKHLFGIELKEKYGLNVQPRDIKSLEWNRFGDYLSIGLFGEKYRRTISWSDDGKQPEDELMLYLCFPTGAYIFGNSSDDDYPSQFFREFWDELKTYNPKFSDTVNKSLYFSMGNSGKIFNEFPAILKKYNEKNKEDFKLRKIKRMEEELLKLKQ